MARCCPRRGRSSPPASARHAARPKVGHLVAGAAPMSGTGSSRWNGISAERPPLAGREGAPDKAWFTGTAERIPLNPIGISVGGDEAAGRPGIGGAVGSERVEQRVLHDARLGHLPAADLRANPPVNDAVL